MLKFIQTVVHHYRLLLLAIVVLLASCSKNEDPLVDRKTIRLMSYNVGVFNKYIKDDYAFVADVIKEAKADAVCLNELDSCAKRTGRVFQIERLAEILGGWYNFFAPAISYGGGKYGEGIVSSLRPITKEYIPLEQSVGAEARTLAIVEFEDFVLCCTHLDHTSTKAREDQAQKIIVELKKRFMYSNKPVFLGGDFNSKPTSVAVKMIENWFDRLTPDDYTYSTKNPYQCIDHIFVLRNQAKVSVVSSKVITSSDYCDITRVSDHFPVFLEVSIETPL